jgi:hypothetical protein
MKFDNATDINRKSGAAERFRPTYAPRHAGAGEANVGHPSDFLRFSGSPEVRHDSKGTNR